MDKKIQKEPYTERELEKKVPETAHDSFGGQHGSDSVVPEQVKRDAKETMERLNNKLDDIKPGNKA